MWEYEVICMYSQLSEAEKPVGELQKMRLRAEQMRWMRPDARQRRASRFFSRVSFYFFPPVFSPAKRSKCEAAQVGAGGRCDRQAGGRGEADGME